VSSGRRYHLVFAGQLMPDTSPTHARRALADFFGVTDAATMTPFLSGRRVPLRRNLTREDALRLYRQLRSAGLICELEDAIAAGDGAAPAPAARRAPPSAPVVTEPPPAAVVTEPPPAAVVKEPPPTASLSPRGAAPNTFALRPAPAGTDGEALRERSLLQAIAAAGSAAALLLLTLTLLWRFPPLPPDSAPAGPVAGTAAAGQLLLLADNALHRFGRSGRGLTSIEAQQLGFRRLLPPLAADPGGEIIVAAQRDDRSAPRLWRCHLEARRCEPALREAPSAPVRGLAVSLLGDVLYLHTENGELLRTGRSGEVQRARKLPPPAGNARILAAGGLLHIPGDSGPLLGVYRPDRDSFGVQLDALLLLPVYAASGDAVRITDVVAHGDGYAALLATASSTVLQRFDRRWKPLGRVDTEIAPGSFLVAWQDGVLVGDPSRAELARVRADGSVSSPLQPDLLVARRQAWEEQRRRSESWRRAVLLLGPVLVTAALLATLPPLLQYAGTRAGPRRGSPLLDPLPGGIHWLAPAPARDRKLRRLMLWLALPAALLVLAGISRGSTWFLAAALPAIVGTALALRLLWSGRGGFVGMLEGRVIAVDHEGRYFVGPPGAVERGPGVLLLGRVAVFLGRPWPDNLILPGSDSPHHPLRRSRPLPALRLVARLLEDRHPWLLAPLLLLGGWLLSALFTLLQAALS
jgi:hypothetical protein